jgi:integrase
MEPDNDPLLGLRYRKVPKDEAARLSINEFPLLLDSAENPRDRILVATGLYLFLRTSELESLRIRDVNLAEGTINTTIFKTGDFDVMPISSEYDKELRRWFTHYSQECGELDSNWYLIPTKNRGSRTGKTLYNPESKICHTERHVERSLNNMGWDTSQGRVGMHLLRRSGARAWFDELNNQTVDGALKIVQAHLHHKSVVMTERYLGLTADRIKRDRVLKGESMFPSLSGENVIQLRKSG